MPVARARSRLVKLILPIESMMGRASNLVMSICSMGVASSSALRVSLIRSVSWTLFSVSASISCSNSIHPLPLAGGTGGVGLWSSRTGYWPSLIPVGGQAHPLPLPQAGGETRLQLHHVGQCRRAGSVEARHRLVLDDRGMDHAEAVELGTHRAAVGAEHADFDIVARTDVRGQLERSSHAVEIVAGRPVEAELHRALMRLLVAHQADRVAPADVCGVE